MIFANLKHWSSYHFMKAEAAQKVKAFLTKLDSQTPDGHYELDGDDLFVNVERYQTKTLAQGRVETHQNYADIQLLLDGSEYIHYCDAAGLTVETKYRPDIEFFQPPAATSAVLLTPGHFMVILPFEGHMPGIAPKDYPAQVAKVVVKVAKKWLLEDC